MAENLSKIGVRYQPTHIRSLVKPKQDKYKTNIWANKSQTAENSRESKNLESNQRKDKREHSIQEEPMRVTVEISSVTMETRSWRKFLKVLKGKNSIKLDFSI